MFSLGLVLSISSPSLPPFPSPRFWSNCLVAVYKSVTTQPVRWEMAVIMPSPSCLPTASNTGQIPGSHSINVDKIRKKIQIAIKLCEMKYTYGTWNKDPCRTSLVAQGIRICLPMRGTQVQSLVREGSTWRVWWGKGGATEPVFHSYWGDMLQLLEPTCRGPVLCGKRGHHSKATQHS